MGEGSGDQAQKSHGIEELGAGPGVVFGKLIPVRRGVPEPTGKGTWSVCPPRLPSLGVTALSRGNSKAEARTVCGAAQG